MGTFRFIWSDLNQYSPTRQPLLYDVEDVIQSITNILLTPVGSRFFNTEFGSFLDQLLHEPMTELTARRLEDASIRAIQRWEPRVIIKNATIDPDYVLQSYTVNILAELRGQTNSQFEFSGQLQPRQFTLGI